MHPGSRIGAVYLYCPAVDFRKSIEGLSALVEQQLGMTLFGDALYVFINRRRDRIKALYWHRNGFLPVDEAARSRAFRLACRHIGGDGADDTSAEPARAGVLARRL